MVLSGHSRIRSKPSLGRVQARACRCLFPPRPDLPNEGFLSSAGCATGANHDSAGILWESSLTDKPGMREELDPAFPPKQGKPVWEWFTDILRSLISERRMPHNSALAGEPRAGLSYG
jgi:hypothetical protein